MPKPTIVMGDCLDVMRTLPAASFDALVTDPPAGIAFMNKSWDDFRRARNGADTGRANVFGRTSRTGPEYGRGDRARFVAYIGERLAEALRLLKPGAFGLVWSIPKTSHWTGCALEDGGFEIRDVIAHIFGQGFPKSKSVLKPAREDWWLVKAPGDLRPLGVEACKVATNGARPLIENAGGRDPSGEGFHGKYGSRAVGSTSMGRWPPNVVLSHSPGCRRAGTRRVKGSNQPGKANGEIASGIGYGDVEGKTRRATYHTDPTDYGTEVVEAWKCVDGCPVKILDEQSGERKAGHHPAHRTGTGMWSGNGGGLDGHSGPEQWLDSGGASRFFPIFAPDPDLFLYTPKASRKDRDQGLDDDQSNEHPTVKSQQLMRWLCRLITPEGGRLIDPFAGSGSTLLAAEACGFEGYGIEADPKEYATAAARVAGIDRDTPLFADLEG